VWEVIAMKKILLACAVATAISGCYKSTIHLADDPGTPGSVNDAMHFSLIGIFELSSPVDLKAACPGGPAVIHEKVSVLGGVVNLVLNSFFPVLSVMNPSVDCSSGAAPAAPAPEGAGTEGGGETPAPPAE
jgi:hypothetical protein